MSYYLGLDTSNYTTSAAVFNSSDGTITLSKKLLPVKDGELGLRQSDAVFHHVKRLPEILDGLGKIDGEVKAVGVSNKPRNVEGSYMPCFLVGETVADSISKINGIPVYKTSHQVGHILAALYSCGHIDLVNKKFIAFHVSGGTTDCLLCSPDDEDIITVKEIAASLDLKAGQLIDRVGLMLGLSFPCGVELERLAMQSSASFKVKPKLKNGCCCLSGIENKCKDMLNSGAPCCDVALFTLRYIEAVILEMGKYAVNNYGEMPIVFAGGVMSDMLIRNSLSKSFESYFSEPRFSSDNAVGTAVFAALKDGYRT